MNERDEIKSDESLPMLLRLALGGWLEGSAEAWRTVLDSAEKTRAELQPLPGPLPHETSLDQARYLLLGLIFSAEESVRLAVAATPTRVEALTQQAGDWWTRVTTPLGRLPLAEQAQAQSRRLAQNAWVNRAQKQLRRATDGLREQVDLAQQLGAATLEQFIQRGRYEEQFGRRLSRRLVGAPINDIVDYLAKNPHVARLVEEQLTELRKNPEPVRELVQGQSVGMATEVVDELREQGVTADNLLEGVVRRVLRRTSRDKLPPPPLAVRLRAQRMNELGHKPEKDT